MAEITRLPDRLPTCGTGSSTAPAAASAPRSSSTPRASAVRAAATVTPQAKAVCAACPVMRRVPLARPRGPRALRRVGRADRGRARAPLRRQPRLTGLLIHGHAPPPASSPRRGERRSRCSEGRSRRERPSPWFPAAGQRRAALTSAGGRMPWWRRRSVPVAVAVAGRPRAPRSPASRRRGCRS